jgi:hypothetical protein
MSLLDLFKRAHVKHIREESLPSLTLVINKIEELQGRKPVHVESKINKAKIDFTNHAGPISFLKDNIKVPGNGNDPHYLDTTYQLSEGEYASREKDEVTGRVRKAQKPVLIHMFKIEYSSLIPYLGINRTCDPEKLTFEPKVKNPLINATLIFYEAKR